jgi:hypothetical protein
VLPNDGTWARGFISMALSKKFEFLFKAAALTRHDLSVVLILKVKNNKKDKLL